MIKKLLTLYIPAIFLLFVLHSCINTPLSIDKQLINADTFLNEYPDSALVILESIDVSKLQDLSIENFNKFTLLKTIAKDKNDLDISLDTLIFSLVPYYDLNKDFLNLAKSSFYSGRVCQERNEEEKALIYYLNAESVLDKIEGEYKLKGLVESYIGDLLLNELSLVEAINHYQKAVANFKKSENINNEIIAYNQIGISYYTDKYNVDSATHYFLKGLDLADMTEDHNLQMIHRHNLGLIWAEAGRLDSSFHYLHEALKYTSSKSDTLKVYFNIARIYSDNNIDSTSYYIDKIEKLGITEPDYYIIETINSLKSEILKQKGNYKEALELYENFVDYIEERFSNYKDKQILEIQKRYNFERQENENHERLIYWQSWLIALLVLVIIIVIGATLLFIKSKKNKKALDEANERMAMFDEMVETYNKKDDTLKTTLLQNFDILKKAALVDTFLKKGDKENGQKILRKFNEIIYGQDKLNWDVLYDTMNKLHNDKLENLRIKYPQLDDTDFKICCLNYAEFSRTEISILLGLSLSTITTRRSSIRKKLGIEEFGNISDFIRINV